MDRDTLNKKIFVILEEIEMLKMDMYELNMTDIGHSPEDFEKLSSGTALKGERIACSLRHLVYESTNIKKSEFMCNIAEVHKINIEVQNSNSIVKIELPSLLPKRKPHKYTEFLLDPLYFSLSKFVGENSFPKFTECVILFQHVYSKELAERRVRDFDNIEIKQITDVIATFIITDDSGLLCNTYNTAVIGEEDCTRIFIMNKKEFCNWISSQ